MGKSEVCDEAHGPAVSKHQGTSGRKRLEPSLFKEDWERTPAAVKRFIAALQNTIQALTARIEQLEQRLNRDSTNSNQSPSSETLHHAPAYRTTRDHHGRDPFRSLQGPVPPLCENAIRSVCIQDRLWSEIFGPHRGAGRHGGHGFDPSARRSSAFPSALAPSRRSSIEPRRPPSPMMRLLRTRPGPHGSSPG